MSSLPPSSSTEFEHINLADGEITPEEQQPEQPSSMASTGPATAEARTQPDQRPSQRTNQPQPSSNEGLAGLLGLWGGASSPTAGQRGTEEDPIKELEEAAVMVADQARHAAKAASFKLKEGAVEAKESLKGLAANLSTWWSNLEPGNQFALAGVSTQSKHQDYSAIQERLGLESGEAILESFKCQLLQTYTCTNNPFTPDRKIAFAGELHITSQRVCFVVEGERAVVDPVKMDIKDIKSVKKEGAGEGLPERLVLSLSEDGQQNLVFTKFALKELEMDSALALLEHLAGE